MAVLAVFCACNQHIELGHDIKPPDAGPAVDTVTLNGTLCTSPPDPSSFPVKVVLLVQQSGSMCILDPPGSQGTGGFCETALAPIASSLPTEPARVRAMKQLFSTFANDPNVSVAIVPFELNVKGVWPMVAGGGDPRFESMVGQGFADAVTRVSTFQAELGTASDYQGALQYAVGLITADIIQTEATQPERVGRTRYAVVLLGSGLPFPRCAANDFLDAGDYATPANPELTWADSPGAGCGDPDAGTCYCNVVMPGDPNAIAGFVAGTDRNQYAQLLALANQLNTLREQHRVADIKLHTVQLFDNDVLTDCGLLCSDVTGVTPASAAQGVGQDLMSKLAGATGGTFIQAASMADLNALSLNGLGFDPLAAQNVEKNFLVRFITSAPGATGRVLDSDGDGLADTSETTTDPMHADSDGDCFSDGFEVLHAADGFDPNVKDARGCDPQNPATLNCACRDTDGDGLSQYAEAYLGTNPTLVDSDADGVSDGDEARWGLDPLVADTRDTDGDLVTDADEIRAGSNPLVADDAYRASWPMSYQLTQRSNPDGTNCYDFTVTGAPLLPGNNLLQLATAEAPATVLPTSYGTWRSACVWIPHVAGEAQTGPVFLSSDFHDPSTQTGDPSLFQGCIGTPP
jgi:hypothetical protein